MSTILYTVVTTLTLTVNMKMPIDSHRSWPMNGTATTQVHTTQSIQTGYQCSNKNDIDVAMKQLKDQVEGTKVAKIVSMECIK